MFSQDPKQHTDDTPEEDVGPPTREDEQTKEKKPVQRWEGEGGAPHPDALPDEAQS